MQVKSMTLKEGMDVAISLALLTDYDTKNAQVVYVGNPSEDNKKED